MGGGASYEPTSAVLGVAFSKHTFCNDHERKVCVHQVTHVDDLSRGSFCTSFRLRWDRKIERIARVDTSINIYYTMLYYAVSWSGSRNLGLAHAIYLENRGKLNLFLYRFGWLKAVVLSLMYIRVFFHCNTFVFTHPEKRRIDNQSVILNFL